MSIRFLWDNVSEEMEITCLSVGGKSAGYRERHEVLLGVCACVFLDMGPIMMKRGQKMCKTCAVPFSVNTKLVLP